MICITLVETTTVEYSTFVVGDASTFYTLNVSGYSGTVAGDGMAHVNGMAFTTKDQEHDLAPDSNCAVLYTGGWWHNHCHRGKPTGAYYTPSDTFESGRGITWKHWKSFTVPLQTFIMAIR